MASFHATDLFGGAIVVDLPAGFADVSSIRQVPDNQEVYLDANGFSSVIFDLTERLDESQASSDEEALKYHFQDIVGDSNDVTQFWQSNAASLARMPNAPAYTIIATQHPAPQQENRRPQPDFTAILLVLVRLAEQKTDIVITVNVPHVPGEYAKDEVDFAAARQGPLMDTAAAIRQQILQTFEIKDFGLFGTEEEEHQPSSTRGNSFTHAPAARLPLHDMSSPAKRRKKNDFSASDKPVRSLDYFFAKQKDKSQTAAPPAPKRTSSASDAQLTDEELARKLQEEWNREDGADNDREQGEKGIASQRNNCGNSDHRASDEPNTTDNAKAVKPEAQDEAPAQIISADTNTLKLQSTTTAEDTVTANIPFDESLACYELYLTALR
ncbi:DNA ligase ATP-dependent [Neofusicoccum parvum]|uniref:DNA ligase ATP-dependent n=1 Tax=Neofusicoccum parvum TaxID=310453 RepID=A0ACB5SDG5_9PEZI|nr:DNA ligase ATP-dependent [Neofusicoccum parvum]